MPVRNFTVYYIGIHLLDINLINFFWR